MLNRYIIQRVPEDTAARLAGLGQDVQEDNADSELLRAAESVLSAVIDILAGFTEEERSEPVRSGSAYPGTYTNVPVEHRNTLWDFYKAAQGFEYDQEGNLVPARGARRREWAELGMGERRLARLLAAVENRDSEIVPLLNRDVREPVDRILQHADREETTARLGRLSQGVQEGEPDYQLLHDAGSVLNAVIDILAGFTEEERSEPVRSGSAYPGTYTTVPVEHRNTLWDFYKAAQGFEYDQEGNLVPARGARRREWAELGMGERRLARLLAAVENHDPGMTSLLDRLIREPVLRILIHADREVGVARAPGATGEEAEEAAAYPLTRHPRHPRGYAYMGDRIRGDARQLVSQERDNYRGREGDYEAYALGCEAFLRTMGREGSPSAINTWDGQILTWGAGFAHGGFLEPLWNNLDERVKARLQSMVPDRFTAAGIVVDDDIRTEIPALQALIAVSETPPFAQLVWRAQLRTFLVENIGLPSRERAGITLPTQNADYIYLASLIRHGMSGTWDVRRDLQRALDLAGENPTDTVFLAACMQIQAQNTLYHRRIRSEDDAQRRRIQRDAYWMIGKWRNWIGLWGRRHPIAVDADSRRLMPCFQSSGSPYLVREEDIARMPANHMIFVERSGREPSGHYYYDMGDTP